MTFTEACAHAVSGALMRRPGWHGNWHMRYLAPVDSPNTQPRLLLCEGWPHPVHYHPPEINGDDILTEDWEVVDPVAMIHCQVGEVGTWLDDEDEWDA